MEGIGKRIAGGIESEDAGIACDGPSPGESGRSLRHGMKWSLPDDAQRTEIQRENFQDAGY